MLEYLAVHPTLIVNIIGFLVVFLGIWFRVLKDVAILKEKVENHIPHQISDMQANLNQRIGMLEKNMDQQMVHIDKRIDHIDKRMDYMDKRIDHIDKRMDTIIELIKGSHKK